MTARELAKVLVAHDAEMVRQVGSHQRWRCGRCQTTLPVHPGQVIGIGLMNRIEADLEPCLGKGWLS